MLTDAVLTGRQAADLTKVRLTLPELLAGLVRQDIADYPRLRPHQRHVWHALLVQLAGLALAKAGDTALPDDAARWRIVLRDLTPDHADDAPWRLVTPPEQSAFLQAPVPGGDLSAFRPVETPGGLDMLIMSKNHDLKASAMPADDPELWLYALVSLQTQEGFLGAGNFGISRMNGGFASRPALSVGPGDSVSARFRRDLRLALDLHDRWSEEYGYRSQGGLGLVWLEPWDGMRSLDIARLDLFYIEICRRIRLVRTDTGLRALAAGSKVPRIESKALNGVTGDLWTSVVDEKGKRKAFTLDARGWSYQQMVRLLFPAVRRASEEITPAPMQSEAPFDETTGLSVLARAVVRGQGKTEGYHERRIPVSRTLRLGFGKTAASEPAAQAAHERVRDAGTFQSKVVFPAVLAVFTAAPRTGAGERARDDDTAKSRAGAVAARLDALIDPLFFEDLETELAVLGDRPAMERARLRWLRDRLLPFARTVLDEAFAAAPDAAARHWRVRVRARDLLAMCFRKQFGARFEAAGMPLTAPETDQDGEHPGRTV
ncbi:type I-E CRISPR-associated protein Cse1/CasA [Polymorphum gilvum]|uniref:type I-E CRISPR-associated protein Cse1/CasA n=1 Tax=Polymorphum gilvum TaxID=991904 RepID=UPI0013050C52|nr:type I-E CRISPR-associated protein Cse1/CasA [Polymorphum gilvum]